MYITQLLIYQIFHTYNIMTTIYNYILLYLGLKMFFKSFSTHGFNVKVIVTRTYILLHYALLSVTLTFRWFLWVRLQGHIMHRFFGWYRFEKLSRSLFLHHRSEHIISQIDIVSYIFVNIKVTKMRELFVCLNNWYKLYVTARIRYSTVPSSRS